MLNKRIKSRYHNREHRGNSTKIFEEFVKEVNSQDDYNKDDHDLRAMGILTLSI